MQMHSIITYDFFTETHGVYFLATSDLQALGVHVSQAHAGRPGVIFDFQE